MISYTTDDIVRMMEKAFKVGPQTWYREAVTGEDYITIKIKSSTYSKAVKEAMKEFTLLTFGLDSDRYRLYWRIKPEVTLEYSETDPPYRCYLRFLVSDKEPIRERVAAAPHPPSGYMRKDDAERL